MEDYEEYYKTICRVCLRHGNSENMISLTNSSSEFQLSCYGKAVQIFTKIRLENECLPNNMCQNCLYALKQAIVFKKKCEHSHKILKNLIGETELSDRKIKEKVSQFLLFNQYFPEECVSNPSRTCKSSDMLKKTRKTHSAKKTIKAEKYTMQLSSVANNFESNSNYDINSDREGPNNCEDEEDLLNNIEKTIDDLPDTKLLLKELKTDTDMTNSDNEQILDTLEQTLRPRHQTKHLYASQKRKQKRLIRQKMIQQKKIISKYKYIQKPKKNIQCEVCNKVLANLSTYRCHMQRHKGFRFVCEHCAKGYATLAELQYHLASSHDIGQHYICNKCGYKAYRKFDIKEHERYHTGERPYACDKCGLTFRRRFVWKKHSVYHMEKTIQCIHCPRKFHRRQEMLAHSNNVHERVYVYACSECDVTYAKTSTVRRHLVEKHGVAREMQGRIKRIILGKPSIK